MSTQFDPYYTWLAIPPEEQPPNLYRLLGVKPLEENLDVIENAADQRMLHLRTYASGKQSEQSQKLLNEVTSAKLVLLDAAKKSEYDAQLRAKLSAIKQAELKQAREERPLAMAKPLPTAAPLETKPAAQKAEPLPGLQFASPASVAQPRAASKLPPAIAASVVAIVLLVGAAVAAMLLMGGDEATVAGDPLPQNSTGDAHADDGSDADPVAPPVFPPVTPPSGSTEQPVVSPPAEKDDPADTEPVVEDPSPEEPPTEDPADPAAEGPIEEDVPTEVAIDEEPAAPAKLPVPEKAAREAKRKEILAIFPIAQARSFEEKGEYASQLIRTAGETVDDPAAVFAMLNLAREQAAEAGQIKLAFEATDMLGEMFDFDAAAVRVASVQQASRAQLPPAAKRDIVIAGMDIVDELSSADKFDDAETLSDRLLALARPLRDAELIKSIAEQKRGLDDLAGSYKKARSAFETLKTKPDDAEANLAAGKYLAFVKQDWETGLAHLAKGSDDLLAAAAKAELAAPSEPDAQEKLADAWWAAAEAQKEAAIKDQCRAQAVAWYQDIVGELSGLAKAKIQKRLDEVRDVAAAAPSRRRQPKGPVPAEITVVGRSPMSIIAEQGMPQEFVGFTAFPWDNGAQRSGALEFSVARAGLVYISASFPETKYEGNNSGGWYDTRATRQQLVQAGWQELGKCPWDETRLLYVRVMEKGGPYRIQTNKYGAPDIYLPPDPLASATAARASPRPSGSPQLQVTYLDDIQEVESRVGYEVLGKHGKDWEDNPQKFGGQTPPHSLTMHAIGNSTAQAIYTLDGTAETFEAVAGLWEYSGTAARTPLTFHVAGDDRMLWKSGPIQKHGTGEPCRVSLRGVRKLTLQVVCPGDSAEAVAVWINPRITGPAKAKLEEPDLGVFSRDPAEIGSPRATPKTVYLDDLQETDSKVGYGTLGKNGLQGYQEREATFQGKALRHCLSMHGVERGTAFAAYELDGKWATFTATVGVLDPGGGQPYSPLVFKVMGDGKQLWASKPIQQRGVGESCSVSIAGVRSLVLEVYCEGVREQARAVWIDPEISRASSTSVGSRDGDAKKPVRRIDLQPKQVVAVASGSNNHTVFVNGQKLFDCGRDKATSSPLILKPGDVITAKLGDRFDINSFWMIFLSEKGEPLFETSESWLGYLPADEARWWDVSTKGLEQQPAQFTGDRREYVDLVQRSAATALPTLKGEDSQAQPIFSPLQSHGKNGSAFLAYVVTVDDLKAK